MNKQSVMWYIHALEYYSTVKMKYNTNIAYNMDEAWRHYKWKKTGENGHILWHTILWNFQNKQIHKERK